MFGNLVMLIIEVSYCVLVLGSTLNCNDDLRAVA